MNSHVPDLNPQATAAGHEFSSLTADRSRQIWPQSMILDQPAGDLRPDGAVL